MLRLRAATLLLLLATGCGPTLTRGPQGWHEKSTAYSVAPLDDGKLFSGDWELTGYKAKDDGFRRELDSRAVDFEVHRREDDGVLLVGTERTDETDRSKLAEVFADRWLDKVVVSPKADDRWAARYGSAVPPLKTTATASIGWHEVSSVALHGRDVHVVHRETFPVPGGSVAEVQAELSPSGAPAPDRGLYLAIAKPDGGDRYVVVAYGNALSLFDRGLADARSFAHRLRF